MKYSFEELCTKKEDQVFDRKSARKDAKGLSNHIVAFANADGGTLVIGIEDNGDITGIDAYTNNVNDILRVPFDYCNPSGQRRKSKSSFDYDDSPKLRASRQSTGRSLLPNGR